MGKQRVIAIDGPSASGKGTVASRVAAALGWDYLDSGALYRLTALYAQQQGADWADEAAVAELAVKLPAVFEGDKILLNGQDVSQVIRSEAIGMGASTVAALPTVRAALLQRQRDFLTERGLVGDGRDMGSVVFPDACLKIFLTASAEVRARRRWLELGGDAAPKSFADVLAEVRERDARDMGRADAPLRPASDAVTLDTSELSADEAVAVACAAVKAALARQS